jgi:hypothetical protein
MACRGLPRGSVVRKGLPISPHQHRNLLNKLTTRGFKVWEDNALHYRTLRHFYGNILPDFIYNTTRDPNLPSVDNEGNSVMSWSRTRNFLELMLAQPIEADVVIVRLKDGGLAVLLDKANVHIGDIIIQLEDPDPRDPRGFDTDQNSLDQSHSDSGYYLIRGVQPTIAEDDSLIQAQEELRGQIEDDFERWKRTTGHDWEVGPDTSGNFLLPCRLSMTIFPIFAVEKFTWSRKDMRYFLFL